MSLVQSPLLPTNNLDELLSMEDAAAADVLPSTGAHAAQFIAVNSFSAPPLPLSRSKSQGYEGNADAPPPSLSRSRSYGYEPIQYHHQPQHQVAFHTPPVAISRSSSYGCESDASCTSVSGFPTMRSTSMAKAFRTTPTSIEEYYSTSEREYDPYAQLAMLWSTPAAQTESACYDLHDDLVDLFTPTPKAAQSEAQTSALIISTSTMMKSTSFKPSDKSTKLKSTKAIKKCTYAARRREVSALRHETSELETQLRELQAKHSSTTTLPQTQHTRESAELERILLARAQEENERLRTIVMTQKAQIRRCDSLFPQAKAEANATQAA